MRAHDWSASFQPARRAGLYPAEPSSGMEKPLAAQIENPRSFGYYSSSP